MNVDLFIFCLFYIMDSLRLNKEFNENVCKNTLHMRFRRHAKQIKYGVLFVLSIIIYRNLQKL